MNKTLIFIIFAIATIVAIVPRVVNAQASSILGPSCRSAYKRLAIPAIPQEFGTSWCWAAVAQNVMNYHGKNIKQCEAVGKAYGVDTQCCNDDPSSSCRGLLGVAEWIFDIQEQEYNFSYQPLKTQGGILNWKEATEEICSKRPFVSILDFVAGDSHSVVVTGYTTKNGLNEIVFFDPADGDYFTEAYDLFVSDDPESTGLSYAHYRDTHNIAPTK
jgi:hypothetical protein